MSSVSLELPPEVLDQLADAIAERLAERMRQAPEAGSSGGTLLDAKDVARRCGRSRDWVYEHAEKLGVVRLGDVGEGKRPRLAFTEGGVEAYLATPAAMPEESPPAAVPSRRRSRRAQSGHGEVELLPIRQGAI